MEWINNTIELAHQITIESIKLPEKFSLSLNKEAAIVAVAAVTGGTAIGITWIVIREKRKKASSDDPCQDHNGQT